MRRRDDELVRLPNEVIERLQTSGLPKNLVAIRKSEGAEMPLTTRALRALNERAEEEIRALRNSAALAAAHGEAVALDELQTQLRDFEAENRQLRHEKERLLKEVERLTAKDAMAISSGGTER